MRGLEIDRPGNRPVTLNWHEIERVDLFDAPPPGAQPEATRLYGTLTTWDDEVFEGVITWDLDESVTTDVLDGSEIDELLRRTGQYEDMDDLIGKLALALRPRTGFVFRVNQVKDDPLKTAVAPVDSDAKQQQPPPPPAPPADCTDTVG